MASLRENNSENKETQYIKTLSDKLKSGGTLTGNETEYLKAKDLKEYENSEKIAKERVQFKKALEKAKTKSEVEEVKTSVINQYSKEVQEVVEDTRLSKTQKVDTLNNIEKTVNEISNEYKKFIDTNKFKELANDDSEKKIDFADTVKAEIKAEAKAEVSTVDKVQAEENKAKLEESKERLAEYNEKMIKEQIEEAKADLTKEKLDITI